MLTSEQQMELEILRKHGASMRELAKATGHSRNTVRRYLRGGDGVRVRKPAPKRSEKLDPFKDYIVARMAAAAPDRIPASVLFREIRVRIPMMVDSDSDRRWTPVPIDRGQDSCERGQSFPSTG